jgi:hypothetical protein
MIHSEGMASKLEDALGNLETNLEEKYTPKS